MAVAFGNAGHGRIRPQDYGHHSILTFASFTTLSHLARSAMSILPRSSGVPTLTSASNVASRARVSGTASAWRNASFSLATIARGVAAGTVTASQNGDTM